MGNSNIKVGSIVRNRSNTALREVVEIFETYYEDQYMGLEAALSNCETGAVTYAKVKNLRLEGQDMYPAGTQVRRECGPTFCGGAYGEVLSTHEGVVTWQRYKECGRELCVEVTPEAGLVRFTSF